MSFALGIPAGVLLAHPLWREGELAVPAAREDGPVPRCCNVSCLGSRWSPQRAVDGNNGDESDLSFVAFNVSFCFRMGSPCLQLIQKSVTTTNFQRKDPIERGGFSERRDLVFGHTCRCLMMFFLNADPCTEDYEDLAMGPLHVFCVLISSDP